MTFVGWCALCAAMTIAAPGGRWRARTVNLAGAGRLAPATRPSGPARRSRGLAPAGGYGVGVGLVTAVWIGGGAVLAAAVAVALGASALVIGGAVRRRSSRLAEARHGDALRLVVAELRAGARLSHALHAAAEVDPDSVWDRSAGAVAAGGDAAEVLIGHARTVQVGHACRAAGRTGAPLADVLDRLAADHVAATDQRRAVEAALAGAHASAAVLAVLPVVGVGLGAAMGLHPLATLLHTGAGHLLCLLGVTFDAVGVLWTSRIANSAERGTGSGRRPACR